MNVCLSVILSALLLQYATIVSAGGPLTSCSSCYCCGNNANCGSALYGYTDGCKCCGSGTDYVSSCNSYCGYTVPTYKPTTYAPAILETRCGVNSECTNFGVGVNGCGVCCKPGFPSDQYGPDYTGSNSCDDFAAATASDCSCPAGYGYPAPSKNLSPTNAPVILETRCGVNSECSSGGITTTCNTYCCTGNKNAELNEIGCASITCSCPAGYGYPAPSPTNAPVGRPTYAPKPTNATALYPTYAPNTDKPPSSTPIQAPNPFLVSRSYC